MARILLVTDPADDRGTEYLHVWTEKILYFAAEHDVKFFSLERNQANRERLTQLIEEENPQLVIFNGHGNDESIAGFDGEILIQCTENEGLLKDKTVHSLTCDSGKKLGQKCIQIGTRAFIGYTEKFRLLHFNKSTHEERSKDEIANFFLEPAYEAVLALIQGYTAGEAYERSQKIYRENLRVLFTSKDTNYNTAAASHLYHNMLYQVCLGDGSSSF